MNLDYLSLRNRMLIFNEEVKGVTLWFCIWMAFLCEQHEPFIQERRSCLLLQTLGTVRINVLIIVVNLYSLLSTVMKEQ